MGRSEDDRAATDRADVLLGFAFPWVSQKRNEARNEKGPARDAAGPFGESRRVSREESWSQSLVARCAEQKVVTETPLKQMTTVAVVLQGSLLDRIAVGVRQRKPPIAEAGI